MEAVLPRDGASIAVVADEPPYRFEGCRQAAADPAVVASDHEELSARFGALAAVQAEIDALYARWAELEAKVTP